MCRSVSNFHKTNLQKNGELYIKRLETSNFKAFSACFVQTSPLDVPTHYFGFGLNNLAPFWTISQRVDKFIDTLRRNPFAVAPLFLSAHSLYFFCKL